MKKNVTILGSTGSLSDTNCEVLTGSDSLCEIAAYKDADIVLNAVVGIAGLAPTLAAAKAGNDIALANKESLVTGGKLVMNTIAQNGGKLYPVDSEHSAIFQCLEGVPDKSMLKKIILTASGGPFFGMSKSQLEGVTKQQALKHPNWDMGAKITIDSATLMNKGLEYIEAYWLFDTENIEIVVHRESVIHSMIELSDSSVIAQLGVPDMKIPIQYALTYPSRVKCGVKPLSFTDYPSLTFAAPDEETFSCLKACKRAIAKGGLYPAAVNGAGEMAVELFLNDKIGFADIARLVNEVLEIDCANDYNSLDEVIKTDRTAREFVLSTI